jgi:hypothetical protein
MPWGGGGRLLNSSLAWDVAVMMPLQATIFLDDDILLCVYSQLLYLVHVMCPTADTTILLFSLFLAML